MLFEDTYKTIKTPSEGLFKDRGSKFFAFAYPIEQESEVKALLELLKKRNISKPCIIAMPGVWDWTERISG
ncbi:hypothetical protein ACFFJX_18470 [Pseudarcicella hirudinis]|uniref:hypothetical protein n=1 Tax=Pseudarcicella hirudinis TaxID=1079859 RepID=UPI0035E592B1